MTKLPYGGGLVILDLVEGPGYEPPPGDDVALNLGGEVRLEAGAVWDSGAESYRIESSWTEVEGANGYLLSLHQGEVLLEEIDTADLEHAFTGLDAETTFLLVLTPYDAEGDLEVVELEVETPMGLPGPVTNLQHSFTTDSLTYIWDEVEGADDYLLTLFRDGDQVDKKDTGDLEATFSGLEDGTAYTLEIRGRREVGDGDSILYEAETGFLPPDAPTGFHEVSRRIIAVEPGWELAEPEKVREVRIQVLLGDEILYDEVKDEAATSRLFPVPMASTDYLVRVRAGNPGGWSDWLEGTVSTLVYPLLDTRLGVIGAAYQEAPLHPDTWNGGSDAEGAGEADGRELEVDISILSANLIEKTVERNALSLNFAALRLERSTALKMVEAPPEEDGAITLNMVIPDFRRSDNLKTVSSSEEQSLDLSAKVEIVHVAAARFDVDENFGEVAVAISVSDLHSEE